MRIAFVTRFGEGILPASDTSYQQGDIVHAMMRVEDVERVARVLSRPPSDEVMEAVALAATQVSRRRG